MFKHWCERGINIEMKDQLNLRVFTKNRSIQRRKMAKWQLFKYQLKQRVCVDWVDKRQNYKDVYGILQTLRGSHLNNFQLKTLKLGWVALQSVTFQLKCLDFQSNRYKKPVPVLSRFCNGLCVASQLVEHRTSIPEVPGSNPVEALIFFSGLFFPIA